MDAYGGFLFVCEDAKESRMLRASIRGYRACSVNMDNGHLAFGEFELCFFSHDGETIEHVSLMRRSRATTTAKYNLKFFHMVDILPPVPFDDLAAVEPSFAPKPRARLEPHILRASSAQQDRMAPEDWERLVGSIKILRPVRAEALDDLEQLRQLSHDRFDSIGFRAVADDKEVTLLAFKLFGADFEDLIWSWAADSPRPQPYLSVLHKSVLGMGYQVREDNILINDMATSIQRLAPGLPLDALLSSVTGTFSIQKRNGDTLKIMNVNRTPLEDTTGADLVYYDDAYNAYIMVQYKMMMTEEIKRKNEKGRRHLNMRRQATKEDKIYYYSPNKKFRDQVDRMTAFQGRFPESETGLQSTQAYRLDNNWFYFKLCDPYEFRPTDSNLAEGMYIPLAYMKLLLESQEIQGPNGGIKITKKNAGRYVSNELFMNLLKEGLIGSYPGASAQIFAEIEQSLEDNRSVTVALKNSQ